MTIRNIIFDLGGVILNIDFKKMYQAFEAFGAKELDWVYSQTRQYQLIDHFEIGQISAIQFREGMKAALNLTISDQEFDNAWNAMLLDIPIERIQCILRLKDLYRLKTFLLSNTNEIHLKEIRSQQGLGLFSKCFDKEYYSHELGIRKPNQEAFLKILNENNLNQTETLFLDDSPQHIKTASQLGIHTQLIHSTFSIFEIEKLLKIT